MQLTHRTSVVRTALLGATLFALGLAGCKSSAPPPPDDASLNTAVQQKLASDTAISAEPIQSYVQNGVATLQGAVSSPAAKALAASDVSQVSGIKSVNNQLTVQEAQATPPPVPTPVPVPVQPKPAPRKEKPAPKHEVARTPPPPPPAPIERRPAPEQQAAVEPPAPPPPPKPVAPPPPAFRNVTIPAGTTLPIRITQTLDSGSSQPGDAFSGVVASDIIIDDLVAIPAGTHVSGRVDEVHEAAHFKGSALLTVSLVTLDQRGQHIAISTDPYSKEGSGRGKNTAEKIGGGAAVGAILGGIFGGGRGAAIGAAAGGGTGAGVNAITRGKQVQIPSESLIRFRLTNSIQVRASTGHGAGTDEPNLQHHNGN